MFDAVCIFNRSYVTIYENSGCDNMEKRKAENIECVGKMDAGVKNKDLTTCEDLQDACRYVYYYLPCSV